MEYYFGVWINVDFLGIEANSARSEERTSFPDPGNGKVMCSLASSLAIYLYLLLRYRICKRKKKVHHSVKKIEPDHMCPMHPVLLVGRF